MRKFIDEILRRLFTSGYAISKSRLARFCIDCKLELTSQMTMIGIRQTNVPEDQTYRCYPCNLKSRGITVGGR
jgi:hypothetical protein